MFVLPAPVRVLSITTKMDKLFCPSCGNPSLAKLGVTLRKNGQPDFHYAKGRRVNIRGSKYPLPNPKVRTEWYAVMCSGVCGGVPRLVVLCCCLDTPPLFPPPLPPALPLSSHPVCVQGGRQGDLLLREDQLLTGVWKQRRTKTETMTTMCVRRWFLLVGLPLHACCNRDVDG